MEQGDASVRPRDSHEAPLISFEGPPVAIKFSKEVSALFHLEVQRLCTYSIICRIVGSRPNRGLLRDLIQSKMQSTVKHVQLLGMGFYHIEFSDASAVEMAVKNNPIELRLGSMAFCMNWTQGFSPKEGAKTFGNMYSTTVVFPGMRKEYVPFLDEICGQLGSVLHKMEVKSNVNGNKDGLPSLRLMVASLQNLPSVIILPRTDGGIVEQRVVFGGLPNQCFYCRQLGHFIQECPKRKSVQNVETKQVNFPEKKGKDPQIEGEQWISQKGKGKLKMGTSYMNAMSGDESLTLTNRFTGLQDASAANVGMLSHEAGNHMTSIKGYGDPRGDEGSQEQGIHIPASCGKGKTCEDARIDGVKNVEDAQQLVVKKQDRPLIVEDISRAMLKETLFTMQEKGKETCIQWNGIDKVSKATSFAPPEVTVFNASRQIQRKKRTFKARGKDGKGDRAMAQPNIMTIPITPLDVNAAVVEQFGKVKFPYTFTKHLNVSTPHEPSLLRVHVWFKAASSDEFRGGFSFMLGGAYEQEWDKETSTDVLKQQGMFFARHTMSIEIQRCWKCIGMMWKLSAR